MKKNILLFSLFLFVSAFSFSQIYEPIKWDFSLKQIDQSTAEVTAKATIEEGWHLYGMNIPENGPRATQIVFEKLENAQLNGKIGSSTQLHEVYDANFDMTLSWYTHEAVFVQKTSLLSDKNTTIEGYVEFMACDDKTCIPPAKEYFKLTLNTTTLSSTQSLDPKKNEGKKITDNIGDFPIKALESSGEANNPPLPAFEVKNEIINYWTPVIQELENFGNTAGSSSNASLWVIFFAGMVGGLLALFTPCVWPIIPMTVSFFLKRSSNKTKGRRDAVLYGVAIIIIYVALGLLITLIFGASALNSLSTNAVFNLFFFALLVFFAISFFGAFEITLPASWSTKLDAKADSTAGFLSILLMAFTLVLVSFSCTGPIIGTLLVEVSVNGSILAPAVGMLGFAIALAIPFTLFAFFPSWLKSMPRSGGWLNKVKVVLAFIELALALKFLSVADLAYEWRILDREVFLVLWIVIFALLGLYLLGKIRFPHDNESNHTSVLGTFLAIGSFAFALYMVPGLWGAPLKAISAFAPPLYTQDFNLYQNEVHPAFYDFDEGMKYAAEKRLPVVVDFSGDGCVNCRKMEASVWIDSRVKDILENKVVLITLMVDRKTALETPFEIEENGRVRPIKSIGEKWSYLQRYKFGANAQPFYVMLDNEGKPLNTSFAFDENPVHFVEWLQNGLKNCK